MIDLHRNYQQLRHLTNLHLTAVEGRREYRLLLDMLEDDQTIGANTYLGFRRAPAAKGNHHAFEGGLVQHLLEMWAFWMTLKNQLPGSLKDSDVLRAILNHDMHKAYHTFICISTPPAWAVDYADSDSNRLMTDEMKSLWVLSMYAVPTTPLLVNAICLSHGGYTKDRPKHQSRLAKLVYLLDELSGNVLARPNEDWRSS